MSRFRCARFAAALCALLIATTVAVFAQDAGNARTSTAANSYSLGNRVIEAHWSICAKTLDGLTITDKLHHTAISLRVPFALLLKDGQIYSPENLTEAADPHFSAFTPQPRASRYSDRVPGKQFEIPFTNQAGDLNLTWTIVLRDGSNYIRQLLTITSVGKDIPITRVRLIETQLPDAQVVGSVKGSPIVAGNMFLGFEHPLSDSKVTAGRAVAAIDRDLPLGAGQSITYSSVIGATRTGQLRRDFLKYIERERAHPYRTFLHYNSWYDIGYFTPYNQADTLDRIHAFGRELYEKRGVTLDSFLFDDGWDNHDSVWGFNKGFSDGFTPIHAAVAKYAQPPECGSHPGVDTTGPRRSALLLGRVSDMKSSTAALRSPGQNIMRASATSAWK